MVKTVVSEIYPDDEDFCQLWESYAPTAPNQLRVAMSGQSIVPCLKDIYITLYEPGTLRILGQTVRCIHIVGGPKDDRQTYQCVEPLLTALQTKPPNWRSYILVSPHQFPPYPTS